MAPPKPSSSERSPLLPSQQRSTSPSQARQQDPIPRDLRGLQHRSLIDCAPSDENVTVFRRALGINSTISHETDAPTLEEGRKAAVGVYAEVVKEARRKDTQRRIVAILLWAMHFVQIVLGAVLTALGPSSSIHSVAITALGGINTAMAGILALLKGNSMPERLKRDAMEFSRLQGWIEETDALLALGVIGRDRMETGLLVEKAFRKYNAVKACGTDNQSTSAAPDSQQTERYGDDSWWGHWMARRR